MDNGKIRLPITEVLLCAAAGSLVRLKKHQDWTPCNAVLILPLITETEILDEGSDAGELLEIFSRSVMERSDEGGDNGGDNDDGEDDKHYYIQGGVEAEEDKKTKTKKRQATAKTFTTIADDCDGVLAFIHAVAVKSPQVTAAPLSLRADKRARIWFCRWTETNLFTPPKPVPQDHTGLMVVLTDVDTRLQNAEALRPIVAAQRESEKEIKALNIYQYCIAANCNILPQIILEFETFHVVQSLHKIITRMVKNGSHGGNIDLGSGFCQRHQFQYLLKNSRQKSAPYVHS